MGGMAPFLLPSARGTWRFQGVLCMRHHVVFWSLVGLTGCIFQGEDFAPRPPSCETCDVERSAPKVDMAGPDQDRTDMCLALPVCEPGETQVASCDQGDCREVTSCGTTIGCLPECGPTPAPVCAPDFMSIGGPCPNNVAQEDCYELTWTNCREETVPTNTFCLRRPPEDMCDAEPACGPGREEVFQCSGDEVCEAVSACGQTILCEPQKACPGPLPHTLACGPGERQILSECPHNIADCRRLSDASVDCIAPGEFRGSCIGEPDPISCEVGFEVSCPQGFVKSDCSSGAVCHVVRACGTITMCEQREPDACVNEQARCAPGEALGPVCRVGEAACQAASVCSGQSPGGCRPTCADGQSACPQGFVEKRACEPGRDMCFVTNACTTRDDVACDGEDWLYR